MAKQRSSKKRIDQFAALLAQGRTIEEAAKAVADFNDADLERYYRETAAEMQKKADELAARLRGDSARTPAKTLPKKPAKDSGTKSRRAHGSIAKPFASQGTQLGNRFRTELAARSS